MEEKYLESFLTFYKQIKEELIDGQDDFNKSIIGHITNEHIRENILELCNSNKNGKYVRGTMIALGNYLYGNNNDYKMLAYAYELFETSILIHDDIIDEGKERRHDKTIPYRIDSKYHTKDSLKFGNDIALCNGIYGYYVANNIIVDYYKNNKYLSSILKLYNDIVLKTVEGEILDVTLPFKNKNGIATTTLEDVMEIYQNKTAWYTIAGPFLLGMMLSGNKPSTDLLNVLIDIGVAFQIKDDLLGIFSDNLGKSLTDIEEFKQTMLYTNILNTSFKDEFLKYYGTNDNDEKVKDLLVKSGSKDLTIKYLQDLYTDLLVRIDKISNLNNNGKDILKGLMVFVIKREK